MLNLYTIHYDKYLCKWNDKIFIDRYTLLFQCLSDPYPIFNHTPMLYINELHLLHFSNQFKKKYKKNKVGVHWPILKSNWVILWGIGENWTKVHQNLWNLAIWFIIQYHKTRIFLFWPKKILCRFYEFLKNFGLAQKNIVKSRYWL
jgi:hypothetical protein